MTDQLRESVVDEIDRVLYDEARRCLNAGADRAAYILSWIAAAEGLLGKLRAMATLHADIGTFVGEFEAEQRAGTAKDASLVSKAFEIGFIDRPEKIALESMRELRNQFGHPTAASPDHETAEFALRTAVTTVLAKPALLFHGAVRQLAQRAASDPHLLPTDASAIEGFTKPRAAIVHPNARPTFVRELLKGAEATLDKPTTEQLAERCLLIAEVALTEWGEALSDPRWTVDDLQQESPAAAAFVFSNTNLWPLLSTEAQDQVLSRCLDESIGNRFTAAPGRLVARADRLSEAALLSESQDSRVLAAMSTVEPRRLLGSGARFEHVARSIISKLDDSSYAIAGDGVGLLRSSDDEQLNDLDPDLQYEIGLRLAYAANQNTYSAVNEVDSIRYGADRYPMRLQEGVVVGALTGRNWPLRHAETSMAAFRLALTDSTGQLAAAALDGLTPDRLESMPMPSLVKDLRTLLESTPPSSAVSTLTEFLDRLEPTPVSERPMLRNFD